MAQGMAINRLEDHTGGKKHSQGKSKVRQCLFKSPHFHRHSLAQKKLKRQFSHAKENRDLSASKRTNVALILIKVRPVKCF